MRLPFGERTLTVMLVLVAWIGGGPAQAVGAPSPDTPGPGIERVSVKSSSLVGIGFAREARILEIEFRSGATYRYLEPMTIVGFYFLLLSLPCAWAVRRLERRINDRPSVPT